MTDYRAVPRDMRINTLNETNELGQDLFGKSPTETQQWVNSLSSDRWLGYSYDEKRHSMVDSYGDALDIPKDPAKWTVYDVKTWLLKKLELATYVENFGSVSGSGLLQIQCDDDLKELGIDGTALSGLHRKKILAHISQLREIK
eukprot:CAMPEP_0203758868 /NCGR_PEP_ID=MMETSP0098-20131031/11745_1 /ASSEMBLY_ACC=CAM_ASM_000208 /TAXON_ID=96639 /ORGANISM=" , Strain NY0313808BC1" /LENGTH=143 /DNA_ID=CAMNT_0050651511 /DNA_START=33 /DNA_END=461 /DNA_ORIENTATION=+